MQIKKNGLTITQNDDGGYVCEDLWYIKKKLDTFPPNFEMWKYEEAVKSILPQSIRVELEDMKLRNYRINKNHFALLFTNDVRRIRRIITDTQLLEIRETHGYTYLDISEDGKLFTRACCDRGGQRVFFDGIRLMSHPYFETCEPRIEFTNSGYKIESLECFIENGILFEADIHCKHLWTVNNREYPECTQIGVFNPSKTTLLENGFVHYDWSDFHVTIAPAYNHILVVDSNQQWIDEVISEFKKEIAVIQSLSVKKAEAALCQILTLNPQVVLLDMHLTQNEYFEVIWIANQLKKKCFNGIIMITGKSTKNHLRALQELIETKTFAPGKSLSNIRLALADRIFNPRREG